MGLLDRWTKKKDGVEARKEAAAKSAETKKASPKVEKAEKAEAPVKAKAEKKLEKIEEKKTIKSKGAKVGGIAYKVLIRPLVTEKSAISESLNKYSFVVANGADKNKIKLAVEEAYGVKPVAVNVINVQGRVVRFGRRLGRRSDYRKAIVTLPQGKSITLHEGV